jgi:pyruvate/2-oxoglutarate dehydrogenase complex dihydrolipoamide acyltransferase (E2) component
MGMCGIENVVAILSLPESAILRVGMTEKRVMAGNDHAFGQ